MYILTIPDPTKLHNGIKLSDIQISSVPRGLLILHLASIRRMTAMVAAAPNAVLAYIKKYACSLAPLLAVASAIGSMLPDRPIVAAIATNKRSLAGA